MTGRQKGNRSGHNKRLLKSIEEYLNGINAIIISDYGKGVVTSHMIKAVKEIVTGSDIVVAVDPKPEKFQVLQRG